MNRSLHIQDFTDPTCPFSYSLEPVRWRLLWLYREQLEWESTMVVLSEKVDPNGRLTPELLAKGMTKLKDQHGMPINDTARSRLSTSIEVCRAYIAVLLNAPDKAEKIMRTLRIAIMGGELADDPALALSAIKECDIDEAAFKTWLAQPAVEEKLRSDMQAARQPAAAALVMGNKLSNLPDGNKRYSAGSYVLGANGHTFELPGFWPYLTYELVAANLVPALVRQPDADSVQAVLGWAAEPLATVEVAAIMNQSVEQVRPQLEKTAHFAAVAQDGFWSLS